MRKLALVVFLGAVFTLGAYSLYAAPGDPGPPCEPDPNLHCLDVWMPVECVKPGEGWKVYSNRCYAMQDCAIGRTCRDLGV